MTTYVWQNDNWPTLRFDAEKLLIPLGRCRHVQGELQHRMRTLDDRYVVETEALLLESEALRTSEIEGVQLNPQSVRSSVARKLGLEDAGLRQPDRYTEGLIEVLMDATQNHQQSLTPERLFGWHAALFPTGYSGMSPIAVGCYRSDESGGMQVVSGRPGKQVVHYEAPPAEHLVSEMDMFLHWFNTTGTACRNTRKADGETGGMDGILRAGMAHFHFVTLHPFDDGNGRLARVITDMAMAQDEGTARRAYSISATIAAARKAYYAVLEQAQKGNGDITEWLIWFVQALEQAMRSSMEAIALTLRKTEFWKRTARTPLNERQRKVLNRLLDAGPEGFEGGLTNKKYVSMTKAAPATATRDLADLVAKGVLRAVAGGRSTRYEVDWQVI